MGSGHDQGLIHTKVRRIVMITEQLCSYCDDEAVADLHYVDNVDPVCWRHLALYRSVAESVEIHPQHDDYCNDYQFDLIDSLYDRRRAGVSVGSI